MNPQLLEPGAERELYEEANCISGLVGAYRGAKDYRAALEAIASLRPAVDRFFDKVLVNAPEEEIRRNRLSLLHQLLSEFSAIADFSEIVTTQ
jgi:glycyl-tRNA synthetase beta chain